MTNCAAGTVTRESQVARRQDSWEVPILGCSHILAPRGLKPLCRRLLGREVAGIIALSVARVLPGHSSQDITPRT